MTRVFSYPTRCDDLENTDNFTIKDTTLRQTYQLLPTARRMLTSRANKPIKTKPKQRRKKNRS